MSMYFQHASCEAQGVQLSKLITMTAVFLHGVT